MSWPTAPQNPHSVAAEARVPPHGGWSQFWWTRNGSPHPRYARYSETNHSSTPLLRRFVPPADSTITDWFWVQNDASNHITCQGANLRAHSPWAFHPLNDLPAIPWRLPAVVPCAGTSPSTLHVAVNLDLYLAANPNGFRNGSWTAGQTLKDVGLEIINGEIPGAQGLYWATTPFVLDPMSSTGWVPAGGSSAWLNSAEFQARFGVLCVGEELRGQPPMWVALSIRLQVPTVWLSFNTEPGLTYRVERATSLSKPDWLLHHQIIGLGEPIILEDTVADTASFYRIWVNDGDSR